MGHKWEKLKASFKGFDMIGNRAELLVGRAGTFKTHLGSLSTICAVGIIVYYTALTAGGQGLSNLEE